MRLWYIPLMMRTNSCFACSTCRSVMGASSSWPAFSLLRTMWSITSSILWGVSSSSTRSAAVAALLRAVEEVRDFGRAVVLRDERGHGLREPGLLRERQPVRHVGLDDLRLLVRLEPVVRVVAPRLVFDEVQRVLDLADVVVIAAHATEQAVRADAVARRLDEVRHRHGVRVRPGRLE